MGNLGRSSIAISRIRLQVVSGNVIVVKTRNGVIRKFRMAAVLLNLSLLAARVGECGEMRGDHYPRARCPIG